jgi:hypothetical protein
LPKIDVSHAEWWCAESSFSTFKYTKEIEAQAEELTIDTLKGITYSF